MGGVAFPEAGDCERGVPAAEEDVFGGGPFAQADFVGSWVGIFCADAVADLLILTRISEGANQEQKEIHTNCESAKDKFSDKLFGGCSRRELDCGRQK